MLLLADDHRYRNISHILNTLGISLTLLITTGCQYAAPSVSPTTNTPNSSGLFPSFFGQTRVAPPPTGSYVNPMQRQKGTNNVSGTIQQPDSGELYLHPFLEPAGILRDDLMRIRER